MYNTYIASKNILIAGTAIIPPSERVNTGNTNHAPLARKYLFESESMGGFGINL
jgi:hypothetical protein